MQDSALHKTFETEVLFRQAAPDDLEDVVALLAYLGYPLHPDEMKDMFLLLLRDPQSRILLALNGPRVAGLIHLHTHLALRLNGYHVWIEELVVHPDFRGLGIGRGLIDAVDLYARMQGALLIEVQTSNKRESLRRKFYEKNGFAQAESTLYRRQLPAPFCMLRSRAEARQTKYPNSTKRTSHG